jgi:hypothetical protein
MTTCNRKAWLVLGSQTLLLEDPSKGYFCTNLDLGAPDVRAVMNPNPDRHGLTDRSAFMGGRVIEADVTAVTGAGARIDAVAASFAPYMDPSVRPQLHYVLDRPGLPERVLTLRAIAYDSKIDAPGQRDVIMQWEAPDPIAKDANVQSAFSYAGSGLAGRVYNLVYARAYPTGTQAATSATLQQNPGDVTVRPFLRIYGPITAPNVSGTVYTSVGSGANYALTFASSFRIDAGHWVDVDSERRTIHYDSDPAQSALAAVRWDLPSVGWLYLPPSPGSAQLTLSGSSTSAITQAQLTWQDGYLT